MPAESLVEGTWTRYAATWSQPTPVRTAELAACLGDEVRYRDPQVEVAGRAALSEYMAGFQAELPGGHFRIEAVLEHHGRSLADWTLRNADDLVLQRGTSVAVHGPDGRLIDITGFFHPADNGPAT